MYNEYEEYMRSVLGYNSQFNKDTYIRNEGIYNTRIQDIQEVNKLYPEIYSIIYPLVQRVCLRKVNVLAKEEIIDQMVDEIYTAVEKENEKQTSTANVKNEDNRNQRTRDNKRPIRREDQLLKDLIRILIVRELFGDKNNSYQNRPPKPWGGIEQNPLIFNQRMF